MAESRLPLPASVVSQGPLTESTGNRQPKPPNHSTIPQKRSIQYPSSIAQSENKVPKVGNLSGQSITNINNQRGNGLARPPSAQGARHAYTKSHGSGITRVGFGMGNRPSSRAATAKSRPGTATNAAVEDKGDGASDATISSRVSSLSSRSSLSSCAARVRALRSTRSASSGMKFLREGMANLTIDCSPPSKQLPRHQDLTCAKSLKFVKQTSFSPLPLPLPLPPSMRESTDARIWGRALTQSLARESTKPAGSFLTKESNERLNIGFDLHKSMHTMESMFSDMKNIAALGSRDQAAFNEAMNVYKGRVSDLEKSREDLLSANSGLQQDLCDTRASLSAALLHADEIRREHLNEIDSIRRAARDEADEMRRKYNQEIDDLRRDNRIASEKISLAKEDEFKQLDRRHQAELDDLRRELAWALEEEKRERKREVQTLEHSVQEAYRSAQTGTQKHADELNTKDEKILQLSGQVEREREVTDDIRKQLSRSSEQNVDLENATRSLKARVEFLQSDNQSQSQAFADLEQRTQDALKQTEEYRIQLRKEETMRRKLLNTVQDLKGNIRVFCRVRPTLPFEQQTSCAGITFPDAQDDAKSIEVRGAADISSLGKDNTKTHPFNFDRAFGPQSNNTEIFSELSELVAAVCGGSFNTCIFSYGQTGSGKTYTMASDDGMIPRAVDQIFATAKDLLDKGWSYQISGSFVEVYNENINDLLGRPEDFDKKKHEIRHDMQHMTTTVTDVVETLLVSAEHFGTVLEQAQKNRSIAATKANERSSRSHSVCILRIEGQNVLSGETCSSTLNLVDLAGSERLSHSQATGAQLKETQNINKSLSCLKDVIAALGDPKENSHVPYRNSKLTYLLQNSLGGNSKTLMFVMISPLQEHLSETLSSLNFATKVNNTRVIKRRQR